MRHFWVAILASILATVAVADGLIPDRRLVVSRDMDFPGSDLQPLYDTTLEACQKLCLDDPFCNALTFNQNANVCFPKTGVARQEPFTGALSARVVNVPANVQTLAEQRARDLDFLTENDFARATAEAEALAVRHGGGQWTVDVLLNAADDERRNTNMPQAIHWTGAALAQSDDAALWLQYGEWSAQHARTVSNRGQRRSFENRAFLAALNAYLRSGSAPQRMTALFQLAQALEVQGRGASMIPALRLAETLGTRSEVTILLNEAIEKYGFRIQDHVVESDLAAPRLCAEFSEPLVRAGVDYTPYVRLPDARLAVSASGNRLCVEGAEHGVRLEVTFRAGLPAASGESLTRDVPISAYIRDRAPKVSFPGRAYVLPRTADAGVPIETVNLDQVDLVLRRVSDRNLIRAIQDSYFGQPMNQYEEDLFAETLAEEVWRGSGEVQNALNRDMVTRLPVAQMIADQPAGVYALTAGVAGDEEARATQWFLLSDIGLTVMEATDGLTVFARGLADAAPLAGLDLTLMNRANRELGQTQTDARGIARFAAGLLRGSDGASAALVVAKRGAEDLAFLSLVDPAFDLSDRGVAGRAPSGPLDAFLTTDRGAYRAGETIHATTLLRDAQADAVQGVPLIAVLTRPDGVEHSRHISDRGFAGGHVFNLPLAPSVPRGAWRLEVFADPNGSALASNTLLVEDFVPERIDFDLLLPLGPVLPLAPPVLDVTARYLFGAPGAGLRAEGDVTLRTLSTLDAFPGYRFGRHDAGRDIRRATLPADLVTDSAGTLQIPLRLPQIDSQGRPMEAEVTLRLSEASGRPVERSITRPAIPDTAMIGIRPGFDGTLPEGAEARFDLIALGPDLSPTPMQVTWQVNRVRTRYQWYQAFGNWNWEPITTRETVARGEALLGAGPVPVSADVEWGTYEIVVERSDGTYVAASAGFDAGWFAPDGVSDSPDTLEMSLDAALYRPGDTATLRIVPRYDGVAQVSVLSGRVIDTFEMPVTAGENSLSLPVTEDWGAGVYVSAQVIRPMDAEAGLNPARALGLVHAGVDPGPRQLRVALDAPPEANPRSRLQTAIQIDGLAGQEAFVTVAAVDLGILNLTAFDPPDPSGHYFGQRQLGVDIRDVYGRLIDGMNGRLGQIRSGGDAQAAIRMQNPPPTEALVAFFSGVVPVGPDGRAEVGFDLPDFNGTVRLMAVAWSDKGVGQAQADVLIRDPVVMTASMPRFMAPGDQSRLLLDLTHAKGAAGVMPLEVSASGLTLTGVPDQVRLGEGDTLRLTLPLQAEAAGDHRIEIALTTPDGKRLTKSLTLGVRATDPPVSQTRRLTLSSGQSFTLDADVFAGLQQSGAEALISAGPLARFDVPGMLASLERYPYGCTEQVTSKALPLLYLSALAEPLGISPQPVDKRIQQAIETVLTRQDTNGAFGLWRAGSGDDWLDAYVTDFLSRAKALGYTVPDRAFAAALDNLANRIAYAPEFDEGGEDIAYALMVLAREGRAQMGDLRYYADEKTGAFGSPLAVAQLGAALASYGDQRRADRMFSNAASRIAPDGGAQVWRADYGSAQRDRAGVLTLAVESRSDAVDRTALAQGLVDPRSTQERAWALMAAHAMVQDPMVSGLAVDGGPVAGPFLRRIPAQGLEPMQITNTSSNPTQITLTTLGVAQGETEPTGFGYRISRDYYTLDGSLVDLSQPIRAGTRLVAVLTVRPAEDTRARLMIDDALPAGFEIDNPSLLQSGDLKSLDWLEVSEVEMSEFRTERFLSAVDQQDASTIRLAYILRAVSPGVFHHPAAQVEDMYRPEYRAVTGSGRVVIE